MSHKDKLLTREEAADYLGVSKGTLEVWASTKRYTIPYIRIGKRMVRYRFSDLLAFLEIYTAPSSAEHDAKK